VESDVGFTNGVRPYCPDGHEAVSEPEAGALFSSGLVLVIIRINLIKVFL